MTKRALMILFALVATPFVASVAQGRKPARPARRAAAPAAAAAASGNCSQQQGQHQGNNSCDDTPAPPPPPPATCAASSAPAGDVTVTGTVLQASPAVGLANWCVQLLLDGVVVGTAKTDGSGGYAFANIAGGTYTLCEVVQAGWIQTFPTVDFTMVTCPSGNAGYLMVLPAGSQSPFNDFINGH